jgi:orotate phosphoribosyltransferase-like protein
MITHRTREELVHQVVTLAKQGTTRRAIARALGVSRNSVRALLGHEHRDRQRMVEVRLARGADHDVRYAGHQIRARAP